MPSRRRRVAAAAGLLLSMVVAASTAGTTAAAVTSGSAERPTAAVAAPARSAEAFGLDPVIGSQVRPNIVLIMADDMRADDLRFMPNVRRLVGEEGVEFTNSFSPHPLCCPARASFLSGQYTHNHGVWSNRPPYGFPAFEDSRTLATALAEVGYTTAFLGKYLNAYGSAPAPDGSSEHSLGYVPPGWHHWRGAVGRPDGEEHSEVGGVYRYHNTSLNVDGVVQHNPGVYQTELFGRHTDDLVARLARSPRPFFLWASYVAPHIGFPAEADDPEPAVDARGEEQRFGTPVRPPWVRGMFDDEITEPPGGQGEEDVGGKPFFVRELPPLSDDERDKLALVTRQRAESLHVLDLQVARTIDALEAAGELDHTIVAFTSDNGFFLGEHRQRMGKNLPYEPSLRVPTLIRGPGIPADETRSDPFLTIDFASTFLEAAGAQPDPTMDGVSLLEVARSGDRGWSRGVLTETGPRRGPRPEKDVRVSGGRGGPSARRFSVGVRTPGHLYVEHASAEQELYDLAADPGQLDSLAGRDSAAGLERELAAVLERLSTCSGDACSVPLPGRLQSP